MTKNFKRHEFACKCNCGLDTVDHETLMVLQECCDHFAEELSVEKVSCIVTSGCRCKAYNRLVGGADNSYHAKCRAVDFKIIGVLPVAVYAYLNERYPNQYGIGSYSIFTHLDTRTNGPARWQG